MKRNTAPKGIKQDVIKLRLSGFSYREIENILDCSKGTIAFHCKNENLTDTGMKVYPLSEEQKETIREMCKTHTKKQVQEFLNVGRTSVKKYKKV